MTEYDAHLVEEDVPDEEPPLPLPGDGRRRRSSTSRALTGCLPVLLVLALLGGGLYFGITRGLDVLRDQFQEAEDYPGPGQGRATFQVVSGDSITDMGNNLVEADVVASLEAFTAAAALDAEGSRGIQVGYYQLKKQMAAADVVEILVDPSNIVTDTVTVPEGLAVDQIVTTLAKNTDFKAKQFTKVLRKPDIGLPDYAEGSAEGYLFPATYAFDPNAKPVDMLTAMVTRWRQAADEAGLESAADDLGYTPHELMTVASLVQAEGRGDDMPKVARVIYNRLEIDPNPSAGFLQIDAAVNYALGRGPITRLTTAEIDSVADSPYNTYRQKGLPPGPIEAPGDDAITAAANPADGPWFFYATVNLKTGETKFTDDFDEFNGFKAELDEYCRTQSDRC